MRDTDADWNAIGKSEPYFGVLTNAQFHSSQLTPTAIAAFYQTGIGDIEHIRSLASRTVGLPPAMDRGCDFGAGVGRLTFAMARHCREAVGVDISEGMREVAMQQSAERGITNVRFVAEVPAEPFDWINSLIVFQHIPPRRGIEILHKLASSLSIGGLMTIQLTYAHDGRHVGELVNDFGEYVYDGETVRGLKFNEARHAGEIRMYDYDLNAVFRCLHGRGIRNIWTEHTDHGGCHGVWLYARRDA